MMTPETYMRRFHGAEAVTDDVPLTAEEVYPSCPLNTEGTRCGCSVPDTAATETCCCKGSMVDALRLLCGDALSNLVNFDAFFFLTDAISLGSALTVPATDTDNIGTPAASLRRFSPCNCDLLDVSGTAYFAAPGQTNTALTSTDLLSICALKAVAFDLLPADGQTEDLPTPYRRAVWAIRRAIQAEGGTTGGCGACQAHCDCDDCCCASGILAELSTRNLSRTATLAVGSMVLQNVTVLGSIGSVLVLGSEALNRFYLVCANAVELLG